MALPGNEGTGSLEACERMQAVKAGSSLLHARTLLMLASSCSTMEGKTLLRKLSDTSMHIRGAKKA